MRLQGYVDFVDTKRVAGWVLDLDQVENVIQLRILLGDRLLAIVPADLERLDLLAAGIPRANCMFLFRFAQPIPLSDLSQVSVVVESTGEALNHAFTDFPTLCAEKFFPYWRNFEYSWWDGRGFEELGDRVMLRGDIVLPEGSGGPTFSINGRETVSPKLGLPTYGRAHRFWYVDQSDRLGYEVELSPDDGLPFNEVWLHYRDAAGNDRQRPIVRFPSDRKRSVLVPPAKDLERVIGPTTRPYASYIVGGATDVMLIDFLVKKHTGRKLSDFRSVLDWGCGCGRTTWALAELLPDAQITGIDIDEPNLKYSRSIIPRARFLLSDLYPPLDLKDGEIDLIFSQSVFTHLSETAQDLWLAELNRILAPGGIAILSLQLEVTSLARSFDVDAIQDYFAYGIEDFVRDPALAGVIRDEDYYRSTFHTTGYVKRRWNKVFDVIGIEPGFMGGHQDAVICTKKTPK